MWIHHRHGATGTQSGSNLVKVNTLSLDDAISPTHHSSGGTGLTASHSRQPRTLSQNLAQWGPLTAPPSLCNIPLALTSRVCFALAPRSLKTT